MMSKENIVTLEADCSSAVKYQCRNGHSACSACCKKLIKGCPSCSQPVGVIRNVAIEKVIESLQVDCKHAPHGCNTKLKYNERDEIEEHENKHCEYRPMLCPVKTPKQCVHIGPGVTIPSHLVDVHGIQILECLGSGGTTNFTMKAASPMTMVKTDKAWLVVNCWRGRYNFGSHIFCSVFGSSKVKVLHRLSLERIRLKKKEKIYLTFTGLQAEARSHNDLDFESMTLENILVGPYLNIPHEEHEESEVEFDLKITLL